MEHNGGNETDMPSTQLCRMGCGFYGCQGFDGMCSKCYKDAVKRRQQNSSPTPLGAHLANAASNSSVDAVVTQAAASATKVGPAPAPRDTSTTPSVETASPTVLASPSGPTASAGPASAMGGLDKEKGEGDEACASVAAGGVDVAVAGCAASDFTADKDKKPKKNRCHTCKKKVGLTGFQCRCGGLYCGLHRYSDKHECTFDYKEMGQRQIRKANPVVVGEKIQKI